MTKRHPYLGKPDYQFWKREPAIREPRLFDPVVGTSFKIAKTDAVVTAGSCFAQHVARYLAESGFNFLVTEKLNSVVDEATAREFFYGLFSARYGNVYTARQLRQLLGRAFQSFAPLASAWAGSGGEFVDPFRPQIQPGGYLSEEELLADQQRHLSAVRQAIETMDVFVFTLGLTEAWQDRRDGAVYPIAPGVAGGQFDPEIHEFVNFTVDEVVGDMATSIDFIREINPSVKVILTVSPVPLNATALDRHVFVSTTHSKSVLRVAAEAICTRYKYCDYFPSYEIITSPYARGSYFAPDCREIEPAGVEHVMSLFLRHYGGELSISERSQAVTQSSAGKPPHHSAVENALEVLCDEEAIDSV